MHNCHWPGTNHNKSQTGVWGYTTCSSQFFCSAATTIYKNHFLSEHIIHQSHTDFNFPLFPLNTPRGVCTVILTGCTSNAASLKFPQFDCDKHTNPLHYQGNAEDAATFLGPAVKTWKSQCWILALSVLVRLVHYWSLIQLCGMHSACSSSSGQGVPALAGRKRMYRVRWRTPPLEQGPRHKPQDDQRDTSQSSGVAEKRWGLIEFGRIWLDIGAWRSGDLVCRVIFMLAIGGSSSRRG